MDDIGNGDEIKKEKNKKRRKIVILSILAICLVSAAVGIALIPNGHVGESSGGKIAVIHIEGAIVGGRGDYGLFGQGSGADEISSQIKRAGEDPSIKAILIRINSPGGSAAASQELYMEVKKARENGKVVVASMGDTAASGGYYVACGADMIVANPGTITGSIGVIFSTLQYNELLEEYGIRSNVIKSGKYKDIGSPLRNMTDEEKEILQGMIDDIYMQFVDDVAEARNMDKGVVMDLADGRIFTGRQAKELGLIDELGNYQDAIDLAAEMAGIEGKPKLVEYGKASFFEEFFGLMGREVGYGLAERFMQGGGFRQQVELEI